MDDLIIAKTNETPEINFNAVSGVLKISGRAYSNDISSFYRNLSNWLEKYLTDPRETTIIELELDYYNSIFIKLLFYFFEKSKTVFKKDKKLIIRWHHQKGDEESIDDANRISKIINLPIERVESD